MGMGYNRQFDISIDRYGFAGTRFQDAGNPDEEKDVVAEHEDKANSFGYSNCLDSHNCSLCVSWF